ncbi:hypothetical protein Pla100_55890 [Neorhodopirellula pilleata]|uniref:Uncharacterized protein n=1 Tax=Neorhodopirellula pilleata TaxID=2714738 RepID=A0A5C5ZP42_9BACT|nr:hypothetical protein Pla100_55890 [Neorhodopirellula pilleata]
MPKTLAVGQTSNARLTQAVSRSTHRNGSEKDFKPMIRRATKSLPVPFVSRVASATFSQKPGTATQIFALLCRGVGLYCLQRLGRLNHPNGYRIHST